MPKEILHKCNASRELEDGSSKLILYTGYNDQRGDSINICVQIVLDAARRPKFPGRHCCPKGVHRYSLPAGM